MEKFAIGDQVERHIYDEWDAEWYWSDEPFIITKEAIVAGDAVYTLSSLKHDNATPVHATSRELRKVSSPVPPEEEITLDIPNKVGEIVSWQGHSYQVISNTYISSKEAADLEDAHDTFGAAGYHCRLHLVHETDSKVQQVIDEQVKAGEAMIIRVNGIESVQFADESEPIAIVDLAYSEELGLFQRSKFNG